MNDTNHTPKNIHQSVLDAIARGTVQMRPRWQFVFVGVLIAGLALLIFALLVYFISLGIFLLRQSGAWFAPSFGVRGWADLVAALPFNLMLLIVIAATALEYLARRYSIAYRMPLLLSLGVVVVGVGLGGFVVSQTSFHRGLEDAARRGQLPMAGMFWHGGERPHHSPDVYRGTIISTTTHNTVLVLLDSDEGTTTIYITPRTRLPYGADFEVGDTLVVVGDEINNSTVQAFGVQEIDPQKD